MTGQEIEQRATQLRAEINKAVEAFEVETNTRVISAEFGLIAVETLGRLSGEVVRNVRVNYLDVD